MSRMKGFEKFIKNSKSDTPPIFIDFPYHFP